MSHLVKYLGAALIVAPFFTRIWIPTKGAFRIDLDFSKTTFLLAVMIGSLVFFQKGRVPRWFYWVAGYFVVHTFWIQWSPYDMELIKKWLLVTIGAAFLIQLCGSIDPGEKRLYMNALGVSAILQSLWIQAQWQGIQPLGVLLDFQGYSLIHDNLNNGVTGALGQQTKSGAALAMLLPVFFRRSWIWWSPVVLAGIVITGSAMTAAATLGGILVWAIVAHLNRPGEALIWVSLVGVILLTVYVSTYHQWFDGGFFDAQLRLEIWADSFRYMKPVDYILGGGIGHFDSLFRVWRVRIPPWDHPHNEFIWIICAFGVVGFGVLLYFLRQLFVMQRKDPIVFGCLGALMVNAIGNFPFHLPSIMLASMVLVGLHVRENAKTPVILLK